MKRHQNEEMDVYPHIIPSMQEEVVVKLNRVIPSGEAISLHPGHMSSILISVKST